MSNIRLRRVGALVLAAALTVAACGSDDDSSSQSAPGASNSVPTSAAPDGSTAASAPSASTETSTAETPKSGGSLTVLYPSEFKGFDPVVGTGSAAGADMQRLNAVYGSLLYTDPVSGEVVPQMAESLKSDDAKVWTLKLRTGVTFTDGTPFNAEAVKFNWDRHADPANKSAHAALAKLLTTEAVDETTLKITLPAADSSFAQKLTRSLPFIASPTALQALGAKFNESPVGAGPFKVKSWVRDSELVLERNAQYWDSPRPYLDEVRMKVIVDEDQRLNSFAAGEAQLLNSFAPTTQAKAKDRGIDVIEVKTAGTRFMVFNTRVAPFDDIRMRRAFTMVIDRQQIIDLVYQGAGTAADSYFPEGSRFRDPTVVLPTVDIPAAQKLVDEYLADTGKSSVDVEFKLTNSGDSMVMSEVLAQQFAPIKGLNFKASNTATAQFVPMLNGGDFQAAVATWLGADVEPEYMDTFYSKSNRFKWGGSKPYPEIDKLVEESRAVVDDELKVRNAKLIQHVMLDQAPMAVIGYYFMGWIKADSVEGLAYFADGGARFDAISLKS